MILELKHRTRRGMTLIELTVVVGIVALLAAIAVPRYNEAMTRSKTARARNDLRVVADALEMYHIDNNAYPFGRPTPGSDPFGVFSVFSLATLTTPIAYCSPQSLKDPFGPIQPNIPFTTIPSLSTGDPDRPFPAPLDQPSFLYFNYLQFAALKGNPGLAAKGYSIISSGPDRHDSFSVYYPFPGELPDTASTFGIFGVSDTVYDPTNCSVSSGDISRWGGALPTFNRPAP